MNTLKAVILNYCVYAFLASILEMLTDEKRKRAFRSFSFCIILAFCLSPLADGDLGQVFENIYSEVEEGESISAVQSACGRLEKAVYRNVSSVLINLGINEYEIYVSTSVNEEECVVTVTEVLVELDGEFAGLAEKVKNELREDYGEILKIEVKNSGNEN